MKRNSLRLVTLAAVLSAFTGMQAKDIVIADGQTLADAIASAEAGDVVKFTGSQTITEPIAINKDLTIEGTDATVDNNKLNGKSKSQFMTISGATVTLKNIYFNKGYNEGRGGAINISGASNVLVDGCYFKGCTTNKADKSEGGAIYIGKQGNLTVLNSTFYQCEGKHGGAIYVDNAEKIVAKSCTFLKNYAGFAEDATDKHANGGALGITGTPTELEYDIFNLNSSDNRGGAILWAASKDGNKNLSMKSCSITNSTAGSPGGGICIQNIQNQFKADFISTTIANNTTSGAGGAIVLEGTQNAGNANTVYNFVNCTITGNSTTNNAGNCGGINANAPAHSKVNIINTILEGNTSSQGKSDIVMVRGEGDGSNFNLMNSIIGHCEGGYGSATINDQSKTESTGRSNDVTAGIAVTMEDDGPYCLPITSASSVAATLGSVDLAKQYGATVDQYGQAWTKPYIGAVQLLVGETVPAIPVSTGIRDIMMNNGTNASKTADNAWYTISGARVAAPTAKGIYIHQGKKVIITK